MSVFLENFKKMPPSEKMKCLRTKNNNMANTICFNLMFYEKGQSLAKEIYPFLDKKTKFEIYNKFKEDNYDTKNTNILRAINFYRLNKNESFAPDLLDDVFEKTLKLDKKVFDNNIDIIGLFYASTARHKGSFVCADNLIFQQRFIYQIEKIRATELLSNVVSVIPCKKNIQTLKQIGFDFVSAEKDISFVNKLLNQYSDNVFMREMAIETLANAINGDHKILKKCVSPEFEGEISRFQKSIDAGLYRMGSLVS